MPALENDLKQDAPVSYATAKTGKALQFTDIALKWVLLHLSQGSQNARLVARRNPLKRLSCGTAEDDGPFHRGAPEELQHRRACTLPSRGGRRVPRTKSAVRRESVEPTNTFAAPPVPSPSASGALPSWPVRFPSP